MHTYQFLTTGLVVLLLNKPNWEDSTIVTDLENPGFITTTSAVHEANQEIPLSVFKPTEVLLLLDGLFFFLSPETLFHVFIFRECFISQQHYPFIISF